MKKLIFLFLSLFFLNCLVAQEKAIKIFNEKTGKEIIIKENKRIRIKTLDGEKVSGRYKILDDETIILKNQRIKLSQIEKIKKNPLSMSILTHGVFYSCGAFIALIGLLLYDSASYGDDEVSDRETLAGHASMILSLSVIYVGTRSPNILKGYKATGDWKYGIIKISE